MGEAVDTIPSILNKCLFVSPDRRTDGQTDGQTPGGKQYVSQPFGGRYNYVLKPCPCFSFKISVADD